MISIYVIEKSKQIFHVIYVVNLYILIVFFHHVTSLKLLRQLVEFLWSIKITCACVLSYLVSCNVKWQNSKCDLGLYWANIYIDQLRLQKCGSTVEYFKIYQNLFEPSLHIISFVCLSVMLWESFLFYRGNMIYEW